MHKQCDEDAMHGGKARYPVDIGPEDKIEDWRNFVQSNIDQLPNLS